MKKILILTAAMGGGHKSTSSAIMEALNKYYPGEFEFTTKDVIAVFGEKFEEFVKKLYVSTAGGNVKFTYKAFFEATDKTNFQTFFPISKLAIKKALKNHHKPDLILSCYPFLTYAFNRYIKENRLNIPFVTQITDTGEVHSAWMSNYFDFHMAPTEETGYWLLKKGVSPEKVKAFGFPVRQIFYQKYNRTKTLKTLGLDPKKKTVLYFNSGWSHLKVFKKINFLDKNISNINLIIVCGGSKDLKNDLDDYEFKNTAVVFDFVDYVPELLNACDLVVSKAGGASTMEIITMKKPVIITDVVPGQEEPNARMIESMGFGYVEKKPKDLAARVEYVLRTGDLARLQKNLNEYHLNEGADKRVADFIFELTHPAK